MFGSSNTGFGGFGQPQQPAQQQQQQPQQGLFGGGGGAFGAPPTTPFGQQVQQQPQQQQQGFGGFGGAQSTPAFGSTLFGTPQAAPAPASGFSFGASNTFGAPAAQQPATGLFGAKPATTFGGSFGSAPTGGVFGQGASPSSFGAQPVQPGQGTANPPFAPFSEKDAGATTTSVYQSISCMPAYKNYSLEELRVQDYQANRKHPTTTSFGGTAFGAPQQQQSSFGAPAPATSMFGAAQPNAFGTPARTGFGAPAPTAGLFGGGATGGFGQPQQPAAPSLFGAPAAPAATGMFGGSGAFGAAPAVPAFGSTANTGGLFGQAPKPATSFSFGQPAPAAPAMGGGLFGQPQQQNAFGQLQAAPAAGGLFGQTQPAQPAAGGFSFGAPKPLFGAAPAAGGFGAAPAADKPAFSFNQPAAGGGLFGAQPQTAFGAPAAQPQQSLFGGAAAPGGFAANSFGSGGLFGAKPAAPAGSLFGSAAPALGGGGMFGQSQPQPQQSSLFGGLGSSFGGGLSTNSLQPQQQQQQQQLYASVDDNAYGSNPLFANIGAQAAPVNPLDNKKKPPISSAFRGTPKSSSKITRLRGFGTASMSSPGGGGGNGLNGSLNGNGTPGGVNGSGNTSLSGRGSPLSLVNGIGEEALLSSNAFVSRPSVKKLVIDRKATTIGGDGEGNRSRTATPTHHYNDVPPPKSSSATLNGKAKEKERVTFNPELDFSSSPSSSRQPSTSMLKGLDTFGSSTPVKKSSLHQQSNHHETTPLSERSPNAPSTTPMSTPAAAAAPAITKPDAPLQHGDYYSIPSLSVLHNLPSARLQALSDLTVGRVGYGTVTFHDPVNLTTLSSVDRLLGHVIIFGDRNCTVYPPDYEGKPSPGDGLNVPATIVLERCWPVDKSTREPIKVEGDKRLVTHVKRLRNLEGTRFVEFERETGKWTFEVEGF